MKDLGAILHSARVESKLSLEDIERETKIRARYLLAMEEGDFHLIPGEVYCKGFLRTYAKTVGLNPDDIVSQYELFKVPAEMESPVQTDTQTKTKTLSRKQRKARARKRQRIWAATIFTTIILLGIGYYVWYSTGLNPWQYFLKFFN